MIPLLRDDIGELGRSSARSAKVIKAVHLAAHDGLIQSEAYMRRQFELGSTVDVEVQYKPG